MADSREAQFQQDIIDEMTAEGWLTGPASGFDATTALYTEDLVAYLQEAWEERWEKFAAKDPQRALIWAVTRDLERHGTLDVLCHGIKTPGVKFDLCSFLQSGSGDGRRQDLQRPQGMAARGLGPDLRRMAGTVGQRGCRSQFGNALTRACWFPRAMDCSQDWRIFLPLEHAHVLPIYRRANQ